MQLGAKIFREEHGVGDRFRLAQPGTRRLPIDGIVLALCFELVGPEVLDLPVLRMDTKRHTGLGDVRKHDLAHAVIGERQVANSLTEEDLVTDCSAFRHRQDVVGICLMDNSKHREVTHRFGLTDLAFHVDLLGILGRRELVGHIDDRGDASTHCSGRSR